jgi:hypothetical protein
MDDELLSIEEALWQPKTITRLRTRLRDELEAGHFDRDFEDKLAARNIPLHIVRQIISSHRSYIVKYYDRFDGTRRIGLWHPGHKYFLAWKPGGRSQFKTCFRKVTGLEYLSNLNEAKLIYQLEGKKNDD